MMDLKAMFYSGVPMNHIPIIDAHCHMGPYYNFWEHESEDAGMVHDMDRVGVNIACIAHNSAIGPDFVYGNKKDYDAAKNFTNRFIMYATLNPNYMKESLSDLEKYLKSGYCAGVKIHHGLHGGENNSEKYKPIYEACDKLGLVMLLHVWGVKSGKIMEELCNTYRNVRFIAGHGGADDGGNIECIRVAKLYDNIWLDTALSMPRTNNIEWLVSELPEGKLLYGTDMPFYDMNHTVGRIVCANIPEETKIAILGGNMIKLLQTVPKETGFILPNTVL